MSNQPQIVLGHEATDISITLTWEIVGNIPRTIKIFRASPTEQLLAHLMDEQLTTTNIYMDTGLTPDTSYHYTVHSEYDNGLELESSVVARTTALSSAFPAAQRASGVLAAAAVRTLTVSAESDSCGSILVSWNPSILSDANTTANRHDATQNRNDTFAVPSGVSSWTDTRVNCKHKYTYNIRMSNAAGGPSTPSQQALCCSQAFSTHMSVIRHRFSEGKFGSFALLVPFRDRIIQYLHDPGEIFKGPWRQVPTLNLVPHDLVQDTSLSLLQSSLGNLETIVRVVSQDGAGKSSLLGYDFGQMAQEWSGSFVLSGKDGPFDGVTGSQALIQSDRDGQDQFELLFPRRSVIFHYTHSIKTVAGEPWNFVAQLPPGQDHAPVSAVSLIQSSPDELVATARITPVDGNDALVGYVFNRQTLWQGPFPLESDQGPIDQVTGSQALIQGDENSFELLVPRKESLIFHYRLENQPFQKGIWRLVATLNPSDGDSSIHPISLAVTENAFGHLELAARERPTKGEDFFVGYVYDRDANVWQGPVDLVDESGSKIIAKDSSDESNKPSMG